MMSRIFSGQGLEIQTIRSVKVGTDGLGVAVYHDAFDAFLPESIRSMDTAVVKFDPGQSGWEPPPGMITFFRSVAQDSSWVP